MKKVYRSALGKPIDMDNLRLSNEETIAIGNMKVNARGDELGAGGQVLRTRNQVMDDYYRLNTPMVTDSAPIQADNRPAATTTVVTPVIVSDTVDAAQPVSPAAAAKIKGSLANTFAKK